MAKKEIEAAVGRQNAVEDQQYQLDLENYNNQVVKEEELRKLKNKQNLKQYEYQTAVKEAQEQAQLDAYKRSNEVYENNLKSIDFYADTARSRVQLGLDEQIAALSFQLEDLDRDFALRAAAAAFADTKQQQIIDNAKENANLAKKELRVQRAEGKAQFDAKLANLEAQETKLSSDITTEQERIDTLYGEEGIKKKELEKFTIEETAATGALDIREAGLAEYDTQKKRLQFQSRYDQLNNQLESMIKAGAVKATGLKGRSASKVLNSIAAFSGLNSQRLNDSLYSAIDSVELKKTMEKDFIELERTRVADDIALRKGIQERVDELNRSTAQSTLDARKTFETDTLLIQKKLLKKERQAFKDLIGAKGLRFQKIKAGKQQTKAAAKLKQAEIAQALGVDIEELELSKEKLAESIMSAGESAKIQLEDIENRRFEAKTQSYAQRMLKPVFGPALPEPFKTPKTEYVKPLDPIYHTKGSLKAGSVGSAKAPQSSGLSTALGIGSSVLGAAAAGGVIGPWGAAAGAIIGGLSQLFK